ncbi:MAG TPA: hypothetical protein VMI53_05365, partial [Opitutaceae bacterium]|nr:hypothetical protein [Opitutaceae bacterium]
MAACVLLVVAIIAMNALGAYLRGMAWPNQPSTLGSAISVALGAFWPASLAGLIVWLVPTRERSVAGR